MGEKAIITVIKNKQKYETFAVSCAFWELFLWLYSLALLAEFLSLSHPISPSQPARRTFTPFLRQTPFPPAAVPPPARPLGTAGGREQRQCSVLTREQGDDKARIAHKAQAGCFLKCQVWILQFKSHRDAQMGRAGVLFPLQVHIPPHEPFFKTVSLTQPLSQLVLSPASPSACWEHKLCFL